MRLQKLLEMLPTQPPPMLRMWRITTLASLVLLTMWTERVVRMEIVPTRARRMRPLPSLALMWKWRLALMLMAQPLVMTLVTLQTMLSLLLLLLQLLLWLALVMVPAATVLPAIPHRPQAPLALRTASMLNKPTQPRILSLWKPPV